MNYNSAHSIDITDESGEITEPVTLQEMKDYLRLEGFQDVDATTIDSLSDFDSDDSLILDLITMGRELIEEMGGISIVFHTWKSFVNHSVGKQLIQYGPTINIISVKDKDGNSLTYTTEGQGWVYLKTPYVCGLVIVHNAGYGDVLTGPLPKSIKIDIMRLVAYMYENRGDDAGINNFAFQLASKYSRKSPIA